MVLAQCWKDDLHQHLVWGQIHLAYALEKLGTDSINIVLTDLNMPYMDGIEFIRHMKSEPLYNTIPVLMVSTEADEEEKRKAYDAGADGYLVKPVTADDVNAKVRELLKKILQGGGELNA